MKQNPFFRIPALVGAVVAGTLLSASAQISVTTSGSDVFTSTGTNGVESTITEAGVNIGAGNAIVVTFSSESFNTVSVEFDGEALTEAVSAVGSPSSQHQRAHVFYLIDPASTTGDVVIKATSTTNDTASSAYGFIGLSNVDSLADSDGYGQNNTAGSTMSVDVTTAAANGFIVAAAANNANVTTGGDPIGDLGDEPTYDSGLASNLLVQYAVNNASGGSGHLATYGQAPTAGTHTTTYDGLNTSRNVMVAAAFAEIPADSDGDGLDDAWELAKTAPTPNLTDLNGTLSGPGPGPNTGDFDGDGLTDLDEFEISLGIHAFYTLEFYPNIDPTKADTDSDTLSDFDEVDLVLGDPTLVDTDLDELDDADEFTEGTDAFFRDSDSDGGRDGFEVALGTLPLDDSDIAIGTGVTVTQITDDASTDIAPTKVYTHKVSGGGAAIINGLSFDVLTTANSVTNLDWTPSGGNTRSAVTSANLNNWDPALGGVTGTGIIDLLSTMTYSTDGGDAGESQTFTLSGLTPGEDYTVRLYIRSWDPAQDRPIDITFTNGTEVVEAFGAFPEDRPGYITGTYNDDDALFVSWDYNAQGTELVIDAGTHVSVTDVSSRSFHMYGLTNEETGAVTTPPLVTVIDDTNFVSGDTIGTPVGTLSSTIATVPQAATYALVSGTGDTDNGLFDISGSDLVVNADFTGANSVNGQTFSVRVQGTGGGETSEDIFVLTVSKDDNLDGVHDDYTVLAHCTFDTDESADYTGSSMLSNDPGTGTMVYDMDLADSNVLEISNPTQTAGALQSALMHDTKTLGVGQTVMLDFIDANFNATSETVGVIVALDNPPAGVAAGGGDVREDYFTCGIRNGGDLLGERFVGTSNDGQSPAPATVYPTNILGMYITRVSETEFVSGWIGAGDLVWHEAGSYTNANFAGQTAYVGIYTDFRDGSSTATVDNLRIVEENLVGPASVPVITGVSRNGSGDLIVDFLGDASTTYNVIKSLDSLGAFGPLAAPLSPTTDGSGVGQVTIPVSEFSGASKAFVRIGQ